EVEAAAKPRLPLRGRPEWRAIGHLDAFPSLGGGGGKFAAERLADLGAQTGEAAAALAADKDVGLSPAARLRKAANTAGKAERKAALARKVLAAATSEVSEAEAALQAAHDRLEDAELRQGEARDRLTALEEEAEGESGNFAGAWGHTMQQLQAVEDMLAFQESDASARPRKRWGDYCPEGGGAIDSDADIELGRSRNQPPSAGRRSGGRQRRATPWAWSEELGGTFSPGEDGPSTGAQVLALADMVPRELK
ncbi:unnamed protein product, partial [Prorocentrum cordatum]